MNPRAWRRPAIVILAIGALCPLALSQSTFKPLGLMPGGDASYGLGLSRDGRKIVGAATVPFSSSLRRRAVVMQDDSGWQSLGALPGGIGTSEAFAVTSDGTFACGGSVGNFQAAVRFSEDDVERIPKSFGTQTFCAQDLSADGTTLVGFQGVSNYLWTAFVWRPTVGTQTLASLSNSPLDWALHVSADGNVAVGKARTYENAEALDKAVWWDVQCDVHVIGSPEGQTNNSYAVDTDWEGRRILCYGYSTHGDSSSVYWYDRLLGTENVVVPPNGWRYVTAVGCSQNGRFVLGWHWDGTAWQPFLAGPGRGMRDLLDLLVETGCIGALGWDFVSLADVEVVEGNVRVLGTAKSPTSSTQAFLAEIPESWFLRATAAP